jgi:hypothetical protein
VPTGSAKESLPCSASCAIATPVNIFVIEARVKIVSGPFGIPRDLSAIWCDRRSTGLPRWVSRMVPEYVSSAASLAASLSNFPPGRSSSGIRSDPLDSSAPAPGTASRPPANGAAPSAARIALRDGACSSVIGTAPDS